jgi:hypothetical protein
MNVKVWAEESGVEVQAERDVGYIKIRIIKDGSVIAEATVGDWRWQRLVRAIGETPLSTVG